MSRSWPCQPCQSLRHTPVAPTRTTTPCAATVGSGTSTTASGPAKSSYRRAFTSHELSCHSAFIDSPRRRRVVLQEAAEQVLPELASHDRVVDACRTVDEVE